MTLDDIRAMSKPTILASEAAQVLGCTPQWLRLMARERPEKLGFPVCCTSKHRVKIPREPFCGFSEHEEEQMKVRTAGNRNRRRMQHGGSEDLHPDAGCAGAA